MADVSIWEEGWIGCRASGLPNATASCKFHFYKGDTSLGTCDAEVTAETRSLWGWMSSAKPTKAATGRWQAPRCPPTEEMIKLTYKLEVDGEEIAGWVQDVFVFAKTITIKSLKTDGSGPLPGAMFRVTQDDPEDPGPKHRSVVDRRTKDDGTFEHPLVFPSVARVEWQLPFAFEEWTEGWGAGGRTRAAKLERGFKARLVFPDPSSTPTPDPRPVADRGKKQHVQWVNMDEDPAHPEHGSKIKIKVGAVDPSRVLVGEDKIYLEATYGSGNVKRATADDPTNGTVAAPVGWPTPNLVEMQEKVVVSDKREVELELELGVAGGDSVKIRVGGTSAYGDDEIEIVNWRKITYEVAYPQDMTLEDVELDGVAAPGNKAKGLPKKMTDHFAERLQKVFVSYAMTGSHEFANDDANCSPSMLDSAYLEQPAGKKVYVYGAWTKLPDVFKSTDARCIRMTLGSGAFWSETSATGDPLGYTARPEATASPFEFDVFAAYGGYVFEKAMGTAGGRAAIGTVLWKAKVDPLAYPGGHPGLSGTPLTPRNDIDAQVEVLDWKKIRITLPPRVVAWLGPLDATHCPVELTFFISTAYSLNGLAWSGQQVMVMTRPPEAIGATVCHELGHSMGQTVFPDNAKGRKCQPPRGLPYPDKVKLLGGTNAGLYYDDQVMHAGSHCAAGITGTDLTTALFNGKAGTCIMFGAGGNEVPPSRDKFCAQCEAMIKARKLHDLKTSYDARGVDDL